MTQNRNSCPEFIVIVLLFLLCSSLLAGQESHVFLDEWADIYDLALVAGVFGASGQGIKGDVNGDGVVDIRNLVIVATHLGETSNEP